MYQYNEPEKLEHLVKECPHCKEEILEVAVKCRHCGEFVDDLPNSFAIPFDTPLYTEKENYLSRSSSAVYQFFGLVLIVIGLLGINTIYWPIILFPCGILFWMFGAMGVRWKKCSNCSCTIAKKDISKCPRCYFEFSSS
jgi:hypothetical protein